MIFHKSGYKILKLIYENPGIRLSELMKKAGVSAATAKQRLNYLINLEIIIEKKIIGGKRVLLKNLYPNLLSEEGKNVFSLIESEKKQEFFEKNKNLISPFNQLIRNLEGKIRIILVFGSFANQSQTKDSDLDILFLVNKEMSESEKKKLKKEIERSFVTFNHEVSPRIDNLKNFKKNLDKDVYQSIIKNHVVVKGGLEFVGGLGGFGYGNEQV